MKKIHIMLAAAIITTLTLVSVLAQNGLSKLSGFNLYNFSASAIEPAAGFLRTNLSPIGGSFSDTLNNAQVSEHQDGDTVIVMNASGDLRGILTLKLHRDASGTNITGGEWAFNVSYTEVTQIQNPPPGEEDHSETLVQRGTIKGTVTGGQATLDGGAVSGINAVQLAVDGGSIEFATVNTGTAGGQITNLQDAGLSAGTLSLNF